MSEEINCNSINLYNYMCRRIVGSEKTVKTKRLLITVNDSLSYDNYVATITSGSFGEGLEMKGSDFDFMNVQKLLEVYEDKSDVEWDATKTYFEISTDDTKLGFVKLKLRPTLFIPFVNLCVKKNHDLLLSNILFKQYLSKVFQDCRYLAEINHGPCLSDVNGLYDFAFCLHSTSWISQADQWMKRSRLSWPSNEVVSRIIEHGVLFVPIGVKGSPNEETEWRISFSAGEKILIYSFNHTQLICYALLKIVLKDIISTDVRCKDLLCSYFLKNVLLWVSEETSISEWRPENLIHCFMQCFKRLLYCVEYSFCPHYFIPDINMFESKIEGQNRDVLLEKIYTLHNFGWRCILFSPQLKNFHSNTFISIEEPQSFVDYFEQINHSEASDRISVIPNYDGAVRDILLFRSTSIKLYYYFNLLSSCHEKAEKVGLQLTDTNKHLFSKYKKCESYLLQALSSDAVSGWLMLASFYYKLKQYRQVLAIVNYSMFKCTEEKLYGHFNEKLSSRQRQFLTSKTVESKGLIRVFELLRIQKICFPKDSTLIPQELIIETFAMHHQISPLVFAHFVAFLCHYHLNQVRMCRNSLDDLQFIISEEYFIYGSYDKSLSFNVLGLALQMIGQNKAAKRAFQVASLFDSRGMWSRASQRLSAID